MPGDGINIRSNSKQRSEISQNVTPMRDESRNVGICAFVLTLDATGKVSQKAGRAFPSASNLRDGLEVPPSIYKSKKHPSRMPKEKTFTYGTIHLM